VATDPRLTMEQLVREVLHRSTSDLEFRRRLLADPYAAIREAYGYEISPSVRIRFMERDPAVDAVIVLPDFEGE